MNVCTMSATEKNGTFEYLTSLHDLAIIISICLKSGHILWILETT